MLHANELLAYLIVELPVVSQKLSHIPVKSSRLQPLSPRSCSIIHCLWGSSRICVVDVITTGLVSAEQLKKMLVQILELH